MRFETFQDQMIRPILWSVIMITTNDVRQNMRIVCDDFCSQNDKQMTNRIVSLAWFVSAQNKIFCDHHLSATGNIKHALDRHSSRHILTFYFYCPSIPTLATLDSACTLYHFLNSAMWNEHLFYTHMQNI